MEQYIVQCIAFFLDRVPYTIGRAAIFVFMRAMASHHLEYKHFRSSFDETGRRRIDGDAVGNAMDGRPGDGDDICRADPGSVLAGIEDVICAPQKVTQTTMARI
jgi:hypothetical protein